jgi:uncharacterized protein involved in tellurium resistance
LIFFKINLCSTNINPVNIKSLLCAINSVAGQKQKYKYESQVKFFNGKIEAESSINLFFIKQNKVT